MIGRLINASEKFKFLSCTHFKNWKCMMSTNLKNKYFLLYEDPKNSTKVLRIALFAGGPILLHSAYLCKQVAQTYRDEELENEVSNSSDAQPQTFASKMYTGAVGTILPYAIIAGVTFLAVTTYKLILSTPVKILLSTDHKEVAIVTEKIFRGKKVFKYKPSELTLLPGNRIQAPNYNTPGDHKKYMMHKNGKIISQSLFDSVFGWNKKK